MNIKSTDSETMIQRLITQRDRSRAQFFCIYNWMGLLEQGTNLIPYFREHHCRRIAIYGAADLGKMLHTELCYDGNISVECYIDRNAQIQRVKDGIPVYLPEELSDIPDIDMVVVTAIRDFQQISHRLLEMRPEFPIVSLETIINVRICEEWK